MSVARDLGNGQPVYLVINVDTEIITGGVAGTIQFKLASDATAVIATDGSATDHWLSPVFVTDDAGANDDELNAGSTIACVASLALRFRLRGLLTSSSSVSWL
jgi:hypothetical protein